MLLASVAGLLVLLGTVCWGGSPELHFETSLRNYLAHVDRCCREAGRDPADCQEQMTSTPGQRPPPPISEDDACVFLCALRDCQWVDEEGRMSPETLHELTVANRDLLPEEKVSTQEQVNRINEMDLSSCQRGYYLTRYGAYLHGFGLVLM